ncbi:MAG: RGCVC family protein [Blastococcus sp.]
MTPAASVSTTPDIAVDRAGACAVCPHALAAHDAISLRFCQATQAQDGPATRGCVCPSS